MQTIYEKMGGTYRQEGVTEELKANDQLEWVQQMNNICNRVSKIVYKEFIHT